MATVCASLRLIRPQRAVDLAPKGRSNKAQANGLGLDYPPIFAPALKGRSNEAQARRLLVAEKRANILSPKGA